MPINLEYSASICFIHKEQAHCVLEKKHVMIITAFIERFVLNFTIEDHDRFFFCPL
jgi:hypothetical protein